ncbi:MAG: MFS transporter [Chloroflexi bacterium]|nr:MFS transporter [Chloroflexota bacterium]
MNAGRRRGQAIARAIRMWAPEAIAVTGLAASSPRQSRAARLKANVRLVRTDSVVAGINAAGLPFVPILLARLGASNAEVSLLAVAPAVLGLVLSIPIGRLLERRDAPVVWFSRSRLGFSLPLFASALVVVVTRPGLAVVLVLIAWTAAAIPIIALNITHSVVMERVGGPHQRFEILSLRWSYVALSYTIAVAVAGQVLGRVAFPSNYAALFVVFGCAGVLSAWLSSRIQLEHRGGTIRGGVGAPVGDPGPDIVAAGPDIVAPVPGGDPAARLRRRLGRSVAVVRRQPGYLRFTLSFAVVSVAAGLAVPLVPLYYVRELVASDADIAALTTTNAAFLFVGYLGWRRVFRRRGGRSVLLAAALLLAFHSGLLAAAPSVAVAVLLASAYGLAGSGLNLAFFEALMQRVPADRQTFFVAINFSVAQFAAIVGPVSAAVLADRVGIAGALVVSAAIGLLGVVLFALDRGPVGAPAHRPPAR